MLGYWMDAVKSGYIFGPKGEADFTGIIGFLHSGNRRHARLRRELWHYGYRIGCYIRDAWQRLR